MGPEDQDPWGREDEEIHQAFAEKDAEIARLKARIIELCDALEGKGLERGPWILIHKARRDAK